MARRRLKRLSARSVSTLTKPGRHADGEGLYLLVDGGGAKRWVFLFRWKTPGRQGTGQAQGNGARRAFGCFARGRRSGEGGGGTAGCSPAAATPLTSARLRKRRSSRQRRSGPLLTPSSRNLKHGFRNAKHHAQWSMTLRTYAAPLRDKPWTPFTRSDVLAVLKPIWQSKSETASRLRGRIERVLDAARAQGLRSGENPARWRGHLDHLLPKRQKLTRGHHAAMPYTEVPAFIAESAQARGGCRCRLGVLHPERQPFWRSARREVGRDRPTAKVWTVPPRADEGWAGAPGPLSARSLQILSGRGGENRGLMCFRGEKRGRPLSSMALEMLLAAHGGGRDDPRFSQQLPRLGR